MKIYYRISDNGYNKIKPYYINNENCLKNFVHVFSRYKHDIILIADNISESTYDMALKYVNKDQIRKVSIGHGAGTFNLALDMALKLPNDTIVYFVENDYLHLGNSDNIIIEGLGLSFPYITLYDHPDKYMEPTAGGNPYCTGGAEDTRLYLSQSCHWKITNSTTMTFASTVESLTKDEGILRKWTSSTHPDDFKMFLDLGSNNRKLISCIPGYATHGETQWLSPLIEWNKQICI